MRHLAAIDHGHLNLGARCLMNAAYRRFLFRGAGLTWIARWAPGGALP